MSRHNIISSSKDSSERRRSSASGGGAMGIQRGGAAGSPRTCPWSVIVGGECGGGESGRGGGVAGVAVREGRVLHPWGDRGGGSWCGTG